MSVFGCSLNFYHFSSLLSQLPIDISKGVNEEGLQKLAEQLEFKGEAHKQVNDKEPVSFGMTSK